MRPLILLFTALTLCACAPAPGAIRGTMPLKIVSDEGQPPRMGEARVEIGGYAAEDPFQLSIAFDNNETMLGKPKSVSWQMKFGRYCRDQPSWVRSVLIGPSGQIWSVNRVFVPAGPDRRQDWSSGAFGVSDSGADTQALLDAVAVGGRFTLALQDDDGRLWNQAVIDTLTPRQRERLFAANRATLESAGSVTAPLARDTPLVVVQSAPVRLPSPPRACPTTPG
jgi:hypothetical protein